MSVGIDYTTTGLIANAQRRAQMPNSQSLFQNADFLALMTDEMHSFVVPMIKAKNDEYFVVNIDVPLVANTSTYTIPTRAIGGSLRDVVLVDANGNESDLPRLQPEFIKGDAISNNRLSGIYFRNDSIVFFPAITTPQAGLSLRWKIERMPNDLVAVDQAARITAINTSLNQITITNTPSSWGVTTTFDIVLPVPLFTSIVDDQAITNIGANVITVAALPTGIAVGQWIAESRTSPFVQLPYEAHKLVAQLGAVKLLEAIEDAAGVTAAEKKADKMMKAFSSAITPRMKSASKKTVNRSGIFTYMQSGSNRTNTGAV